MLKIFEILSRENLPFSQLISPLKKYFVSGEINFEVVSPDSVLKNFESYYKDAKIQKVDGLTVEYKDWWFNLRKSNTESLVRLNLEANSSRLLEEKKKELINLINGKQ